MKFRQIEEENTAGLPVVYVNRDDDCDNIFEEDRILWDPTPKALAMAESSPLTIDSKKLLMVDCNNDLLGFYFLEKKEGKHTVLEPYYSPTFKDLCPPAPKRPRAGSHGTTLDKESLANYLNNLKEFLA